MNIYFIVTIYYRYKRVVEVCCLKSDFEILPAGDQTEVTVMVSFI